MTVSQTQSVASLKPSVKQKPTPGKASTPIRIAQKTKDKLDNLIAQANKDRIGRKIKPDDLICYALALLESKHVEEICAQTLSNKDKLEILFKKVSKERKGMSRDDFFGLLLRGEINASQLK